MGGRVAGAPTPLICLLLLLGPGHCLTGWHRAVLATRPQARVWKPPPSIYLSSSSCRLPLAPQPLPESWRPPRDRTAGRAQGQLLQCLGDSPPWETCNPGPPRSQGAGSTSQEESQTGPPTPRPKPSPAQHKQGQAHDRAGAEAACVRWLLVRLSSTGRQAGARARVASQAGQQPRGAGEGRCGRHP